MQWQLKDMILKDMGMWGILEEGRKEIKESEKCTL